MFINLDLAIEDNALVARPELVNGLGDLTVECGVMIDTRDSKVDSRDAVVAVWNFTPVRDKLFVADATDLLVD